MSQLFRFSTAQVKDAFSECGGIFLSTVDTEDGGETLYQLAPACVPFIRRVSVRLNHYAMLERTVEHFKTQGSHSTPREAAIIVNLEKLIRRRKFEEIITVAQNFPKDDPILVNPKICSFIGQAYSEMDPQYREKAREFFRAARSVKLYDVFMMRRWYYMELMSGYGLVEAERICKTMIGLQNTPPRYRCEFLSKLANCYSFQAQSHQHTNKERFISYLKESIFGYLEALRIGGGASNIDLTDTLIWLEKPLARLVSTCRNDTDEIFSFLDRLTELKHDCYPEGASLIMSYVMRLPVPTTKEGRARMRAHCNKIVGKIRRITKSSDRFPGLNSMILPLDALRAEFESLDKSK